ncbi:c-type cytochrome [Minwuia sp.]|uniref:c-type cytochrome n=1 Tax=Minwuia sp. TaxID=2493630 RepID=UPI003A8C91EB
MRFTALALFAALLAMPAFAEDGDPEQGAVTFKRFCKQCHEPFPGDPLAAPNLNGIIGKPIAAAENYRYSDAFIAKREEGFIWTEQNLRDFLRAPREYIPGSIMVFAGLKRLSHRNDMIAYLKSLPAGD